MSGGLFALLDDVAVLARMAAASVDDVGLAAGRASMKAAGVVVDDTAVTPQYVQGVAADRELPMIKQIAIGSLRNKLLIILPAALLLSQFLPWVLTPVLMLGGAFLCFEGAEKIWHRFGGGHHEAAAAEQEPAVPAPEAEKKLVSGAIRTDLILSAEIMVISLNEIASEGFVSRAVILVVVALLITAVVYGVVALIVKMDDIGLSLAQRSSTAAQRFGRGLVNAMPKVLAVISVVGTVAMLWVGGHILLVGMDDLGLSAPYDAVHHLEEAVHDGLGAVGGVAGWLVNTFFSAVLGVVVGAVVVAVVQVLPFGPGKGAGEGHGKGTEEGAHQGADEGHPKAADEARGAGAEEGTAPH